MATDEASAKELDKLDEVRSKVNPPSFIPPPPQVQYLAGPQCPSDSWLERLC
jgi:hypothetical protein